MIRKLRIKFVFVIMTIVTLILGATLGLVYHFMQRNIEHESIQRMRTAAVTPFRPGRPGDTEREFNMPHFSLEIDESGNLSASGGEYYDLSDEAFLRELMDAVLSSAEQTGVISAYNLRFWRVSASSGGQRYVFADLSVEQSTLGNLMRTCIFIGIISFFAFLLISIFLSRWVVKPVDVAWNQQRQFIADASHELKTPLTVIITNAELLQSSNQDEAAKQRFSRSILTVSHEMRRLVEGMLELARMDTGAVKSTMEQQDLSALISNAILPFEPLYFEKGLELRCDIEDGVRLKGSEGHLRQLPEIFLDNALKYAYPQSAVEVALKRQGHYAHLTVMSYGEGIPPEELKNIFKRFYRVDKSRSMSHSYGLGLAIADGIVKDHRGRIWAESEKGITTFHVLLPLA